MSNNLTAASPEYRSKRSQLLLKKLLVAREIANMEEQSLLSNGQKVHRPYFSDVQVNTYVKGTAVTPQDVTATDEYLTVDQTKEATVYIDRIDQIQNKYDAANNLIDRITYQLKRDIDGQFLAEVASASYTLDDSDFGGTAGIGITVTSSNLIRFMSLAEAKLNQNNVEDTKPWYAVVTPAIKAVMQQSMVLNGFNKADEALSGVMQGNGAVGRFGNFNVFSSTDVLHTNKFTTSAILVDNETVTVAGVVFTAAANGAAATAGEFSISTTEDLCMANLVLAINGTGTPGASTYIEVSAADRLTLKNARVSASYASHVLTITSSGSITTAETSTVGAWGSQVASCFFGQYGAVDMVIQAEPTVQMNKEPLKTGYNYLVFDLFGIKTFREGAQRSMKVLVVA